MLGTFDFAGAAALVAAFGVIVTSVLQFLARGKINATATNAENTAAAVTTSNGQTLASVVEDVSTAVAAGNGTPPPAGG